MTKKTETKYFEPRDESGNVLRPELVEAIILEINENPDNPREFQDDETFQELLESIRDNGVQVPVAVRYRPGTDDPENRLVLIYGHRRLEAAKRLGMTRIPALHYGALSAGDAQVLTTLENAHRKPLTAWEEISAIEYLLKTHTQERVASRLNIPVSRVRQAIRVQEKLSDDIRESMQTGWIGIRKLKMAHLCELVKWPVHVQEYIFCPGYERDFFDYETSEPLPVSAWRKKFRAFTWDLSKAKWNLKKEIAGLQACSDCTARTDAEGSLFEEEEISSSLCLDKTCYQAKWTAWAAQKVHEAKRKGVKIVSNFPAAVPQAIKSDLASFRWDVAKKTEDGAIEALEIDPLAGELKKIWITVKPEFEDDGEEYTGQMKGESLAEYGERVKAQYADMENEAKKKHATPEGRAIRLGIDLLSGKDPEKFEALHDGKGSTDRLLFWAVVMGSQDGITEEGYDLTASRISEIFSDLQAGTFTREQFFDYCVQTAYGLMDFDQDAAFKILEIMGLEKARLMAEVTDISACCFRYFEKYDGLDGEEKFCPECGRKFRYEKISEKKNEIQEASVTGGDDREIDDSLEDAE